MDYLNFRVICPIGINRIFINLGGGNEASLLTVISMVEKISGRRANLQRHDRQKGDVRRTQASTERARAQLGFHPRVGLAEGLALEWEWIKTVEL